MLNKVMIIGNLSADPQLKYMPSGAAVCNFTIATDESYHKGQEKVERTEWHKITVYGKQAEPCANYLGKGRKAYVEGRLQTKKWQGRDGKDRSATEIVAQKVVFLGSKDDREAGGRQAQGRQPRARQRGTPSHDERPAYPTEADGTGDVGF